MEINLPDTLRINDCYLLNRWRKNRLGFDIELNRQYVWFKASLTFHKDAYYFDGTDINGYGFSFRFTSLESFFAYLLKHTDGDFSNPQ